MCEKGKERDAAGVIYSGKIGDPDRPWSEGRDENRKSEVEAKGKSEKWREPGNNSKVGRSEDENISRESAGRLHHGSREYRGKSSRANTKKMAKVIANGRRHGYQYDVDEGAITSKFLDMWQGQEIGRAHV